jgi:murein L,D-transpeptidase YafK
MRQNLKVLIQSATCAALLAAGVVASSETEPKAIDQPAAKPVQIETDASANPMHKPDPVVQPPPEGKLPRALVSLTAASPYALLVDKKTRTMTVWKWNVDKPELVTAYPTDIGRNDGNKTEEGDRRTPEGVYFFQKMLTKSELDFNLYGGRAYTTDYPNYFDRLEKKTGTGIWLHAVPDTQTLWRGSKGCVVVRNKVIEELSPYISIRTTPMVVQSNVEYMDPAQWKSEREKIFGWLDKWRQAWETKDLDNYMTYYDDNFHSLGMNKAKWKRYKHSLGDKYSFIKVSLSDIQAFKHNGKFMIRFMQKYESDQKQDLGEKILYVQDASYGMGIVGEEWMAKSKQTNLSALAGSASSASN